MELQSGGEIVFCHGNARENDNWVSGYFYYLGQSMLFELSWYYE